MTAHAEAARVLYEAPHPVPVRTGRPGLLLAGLLAACLATGGLLRLVHHAPTATPAAASHAAPASAAGRPLEPRTAAGAQAAALGMLALYGGTGVYDSTRRPQLLASVLAPGASALVAQLEQGFALAAKHLGLDSDGRTAAGTLVAREVPVGVRLLSLRGDRAVVSVWATGLLGIAGATSRLPVQESWSTETVVLMWTPQGWKWADLQHTDGPAPIGSAQVPAGPAAVASAAQQYEEVTRVR